jgi:hypothetical protein
MTTADQPETKPPLIADDDFARRFSLRAGNLMWLLGAGASASAGIPTAWDMIWEFKQRLFVSQRRVAPETVADLASPMTQARLQAHIDSAGDLPASGDADEYAALFEAAFQSETDRRSFLDSKLAGAKPSYGHLALASFMRAQSARIVWTTNFDPLVADACAKVFQTTGTLTTVSLDAPDLAAQCISEGRWPVEIKLHGDFRSRRLKNTADELRHQDQRLRQVLIDSCRRFGLVVAGYSGRDSSVMDALDEAVKQPDAFPAGLFWLHRGDALPSTRVIQVIERARSAGFEAGVVRVNNFDEAMRDLVRVSSGIDTAALDAFGADRKRWSAAPRVGGNTSWPVIRLNGLPLAQVPTVCRRIVCEIGGLSEVRKAVADSNADILVARTRAGVLAFGADTDVRSAFQAHGITEFDLLTIEPRRLRHESGERGLLRDALTRSIAPSRGLAVLRRRSSDLLTPADAAAAGWAPLRKQVGALSGSIKEAPGLVWSEGISSRLEWAHDQLWLLFEPRTIFHGLTDENRAIAADFSRVRTVKRYNRQLNDLIAFWAELLAGDGSELRAMGIGDGVDAVFKLSKATGFSRRAHA